MLAVASSAPKPPILSFTRVGAIAGLLKIKLLLSWLFAVGPLRALFAFTTAIACCDVLAWFAWSLKVVLVLFAVVVCDEVSMIVVLLMVALLSFTAKSGGEVSNTMSVVVVVAMLIDC